MTREEAINKVREMNLPKETKEILEALAPELTKSEDERIRARLIEYFQGFLEGYEDCYKDGGCVKWEGLDVKSILAWLEKQKENANSFTDGVIEVRSFQRGIAEGRRLERQKECVADSSKTSANEDESIRKFLVDYFTSYKIGNVATKLNGVRIDDILNYLEKQKELPFVKDVVLGLPGLYFYDGERMHFGGSPAMEENPYDFAMSQQEKQKEQKPAEVDESTKRLNDNWMKQHFDEYTEQKPAEWSEEDEEMLNSCISSIEESKENRYAYKETDGDTSYDREVDWLKSLRPQPKQEIYQSVKHDLAIKFMNYLDENRPDGKMGLSNGECEDIDKAFNENDWAKILRYAEKYGKKN